MSGANHQKAFPFRKPERSFQPNRNTSLQNYRILLVEDNPGDARLISELLKDNSYFGYHLTRVGTLRAAIDKITQDAFDAVLLDPGLPDSFGIETFTDIQKAANTIPVVVLSGNSDAAFVTGLVSNGAQDFLIKGTFDGEGLSRSIRYAIERNRNRLELLGALQTIQQNEERFRTLLEDNSDSILVVDSERVVRFANTAALSLFGRPAEDLLGRIIDIDLQPGASGSFDIVRKDGTRSVAEMRVSSTEWEDEPAHLVIMRDVTEMERTGERLRQTEQRFSVAFRESPMASSITRISDRRIIDVNKTLVQLTGYSAEELLGKTVKDLRIWQDESQHQEFVRKVDTDSSVRNQEFTYRKKDGEIRHGIVSAVTIMVNEEPCVLSMFTDVTEKKAADRAMRESEEKYRNLFETSKDAIFLATMEGRLIDINPAGVELLGFEDKSELLQRNFETFHIDADKRKQLLERLERHGFVKDFEISMKRPDGSVLALQQTSDLVRDTSGAPLYYRAILRNVTHLKQLQEQLLQSQKMEIVGQLAGGVAHDFNNLLMAINGYCELMLAQLKDPDPLVSNVLGILDVAKRGAALTTQLLAFSRKHTQKAAVIELNKQLSQMSSLMERLIGEQIELSFAPEQSLNPIQADPAQLEQVILNLVVNAKDAMPRGGKLTIQTANVYVDEHYSDRLVGATPGDYVALMVSDNGCGMAEEVRLRIFEPFFTTKDRGTGLGLATVYGIVRQCGGHILVYSEIGKGTTFKILIPAQEKKEELKAQAPLATETRGGIERILLVDDSASVRGAISALLRMHGYTVISAANGFEALSNLDELEESVDLLVTDLVMPEMSGQELAEKVLMRFPLTKVLYMSGYSEEAVVRNGMLSRETYFLAKPAPVRVLLSKIREILSSN